MRCVTSDKWFDIVCRPICPAHSGRSGWVIRVVRRLHHSYGYAFHRPPCGLIPPWAMMASAVVNSSG